MPTFTVPMEHGGPVTVTLDSVPKDEAERDRLIDEQIAKGAYKTTEKTFLQKAVRGGALATAGGALGGAGGAILGSVVPGIGTTAGALGGAMLGSAGGEAITQYFDPLGAGIEQPSNAQIALAGAIPAVSAGAGALLRQVPGMSGGLQQAMQSRVGQAGENLLAPFVPAKDAVRQLWAQATSQGKGVLVLPQAVATAVADLETEVGKSSIKSPASARLLDQVKSMYADPSGGTKLVPLDEFRATMQDLGAKVGAMARTGGPAYGRAAKLYGEMWTDLERTVSNTQGPLGDTLRQAVDGTKRELAGDLLSDIFQASAGYVNGVRQMNLDTVLTKIDKARPVLSKYLPEGDIKAVMDTVKANVTPLMPQGGRTAFDQLVNMAPGVASRMLLSSAGRALVAAGSRVGTDVANAGLQGGRAAMFGDRPQMEP